MTACDCRSYNRPEETGSTPEVVLDQARYFPGVDRRTVCVDACIASVIEALWMAGVRTRGGDVLRMRWSDIDDGAIRVKQGKTGNELWIPLTPRLAGVLDAHPRLGLTICAGDDSRPLSYRRAAYAFDAFREVAGCGGFTIHGLRHSTAAELAEAGCTEIVGKSGK